MTIGNLGNHGLQQILESKAKFGVVGSGKEETVKARSHVLSGIAWIASKFSSKAAEANKQAKLNFMTAISKQFNLDLDAVKTTYGKALEFDKGTPLKLSTAKAIVNHSIEMQTEGKDRVIWNRDAMSSVTSDKRNIEMTKTDEKLEAVGEGTLKNSINSIFDDKSLSPSDKLKEIDKTISGFLRIKGFEDYEIADEMVNMKKDLGIETMLSQLK